jgi:hypothetical protein
VITVIGRTRSASAMVEVHEDFLDGQIEALGDGIDDAIIGLIRDDERDIRS